MLLLRLHTSGWVAGWGVLFALNLLTAPLRAERLPLTTISGLAYQTQQVASISLQATAHGSVLVFLSSRCPCSISNMAELASLQTQFPSFRFVGIHANANEFNTQGESFFRGAGLGFPVIQDTKGQYLQAFKALKTPHVYVYDAQGTLRYEGGVADSRDPRQAKRHFLKEALSALAQGRLPEVNAYRTLGCAIARRG